MSEQHEKPEPVETKHRGTAAAARHAACACDCGKPRQCQEVAREWVLLTCKRKTAWNGTPVHLSPVFEL